MTEPNILTEIMEGLRAIDPKFKPTDAGYSEYVVLLASFTEGADDDHLAKVLGYDIDFVKTVGARLRASGIWTADELSKDSKDAWFKDGGDTAFFLDGAVATGDLVVVSGGNGLERQFKMTDSGLAAGAKLMKQMSHKKRRR